MGENESQAKITFSALFLSTRFYSQHHSLFQASMSVEDYTREFEKLLIKCDI